MSRRTRNFFLKVNHNLFRISFTLLAEDEILLPLHSKSGSVDSNDT
jgi:hypothetical protein